MKKTKSIFAIIIALLMVMSGLVGCAKSANQQTTPEAANQQNTAGSKTAIKNSDTMVYAVNEAPTTLDPAIAYDPVSDVITSQTYEGLVTYKGGGNEIAPLLATSWDTQDNGKVWIFHLRQGVKFQDGTPFNATAVKLSFDRLLKINQGPAWMFNMIKSVDPVDGNTVKFTLAYPFVPFLDALAQPCGSMIISPKAIQDHSVNGDQAQGWLEHNTCGTGPYKLDQYNIGQDLTMGKFDDYWGGWSGNHVSKVLIKVVPEANSQQLMLENGDADMTNHISRDALPQLAQNKDLAIEPVKTVNFLDIWFNNQRGALKNKLVRQAMSYAFSYNDALSIYNGQGTRMQGPLPLGMWGHDDKITPYNTDLNKAKQLLGQAGYAGGGGLKFNIQVETGNDEYKRIAELFQTNMKEIGIEINIQVLDWATIKATLSKPDTAPDMFVSGFFPDYMDPDDVLNACYNSAQIGIINQSFYINKKVDELLNEARQLTDKNKREQLYDQIQEIVNDDAPDIFILMMGDNVQKRTWVQGCVYHPILSYRFYNMSKS